MEISSPQLAAAQERWLLGDAWNPDDIGLDDYRRADKRSAAVRYAHEYFRRNVSRRYGSLRHKDERVAQWLEEMVEPACRRGIKPLLSAQYYGCALADVVWEPAPGMAAIRLREVRRCKPELWWHGEPETDGDTRALIGWRLSSGERIAFFSAGGMRQVVHACPDDEDGPWGDPCARRTYGHFLGLIDTMKREMVACDTAAMPRVIFPRSSAEQGEEYVQAFFSLGTNGAMAVEEQHAAQVKELASALSGGSPFSEPINRHITGIFASFYEPPLLHVEAQFGTRAQAGTQLEAWMGTETALAEDLRDDVLIPQILLPGMQAQFGPRVPAPTWEIIPAEPLNRLEEAQVWQAMRIAGFVDAGLADQAEEFGERLGVPMAQYLDTLAERGQTPQMAYGGEGRAA